MKIFRLMLCIAAFSALTLSGCSKSDDQKRFEDRAFSAPENYTATDADGRPSGSNRTDPDDWRISPMYQGLIEVSTPAYPNPAALNNSFRIDIDILGFESVPGIEIFLLRTANEPYGPVAQYDQSTLNPGVKVLVLDPSSFSGSGSAQGVVGLNRLIFLDGRNNVVTYGDVMIE